jgi:hypothetical protein
MTIPIRLTTYVGVPANPDRKLARSIASVVASYSQVLEAHLPMVFDPQWVRTPALVLFLVIEPMHCTHAIVKEVNNRLASTIPGSRGVINTLAIQSNDPLLDSLAKAKCRILRRSSSGKAMVEQPWSGWRLLLSRIVNRLRI